MRGGLAWLVVAALGSARGEANPAHPTKVRAGLALPPCDPLAPRPRVHVYNLPEDLTDAPNSERRWRSYAMFFARVRTSPFYEADGRCADYFLIPHRAFTFVTSKQPAMRGLAPRLFSFIAQRWPYWNASARVDSARHIIYSPCDYGPECLHVDKAYKSRSARRLPRAHPADRTRLVLHVELTGREDWRPSLDGGETCGRCFLPGVDIRLPSPPDHNCGPLCGYSHAVLVRNAIWGRPPAERRALLAARREHTFFFAGRSMHTGDARSLLRAHHAGRPGWRIGVSAGLGGRVSISDAMLSASFCGSPPGKQDGDSDRFLPALLFGCIPVFFEHDGQREWRPLEGHPDVPWDAFSLRVRTRDIAQLHAVLGNISHARVVRMRTAMAGAWERMLFTSFPIERAKFDWWRMRAEGGEWAARKSWKWASYLGESGSRDAFAGLMDILRARLQPDAPPLMFTSNQRALEAQLPSGVSS